MKESILCCHVRQGISHKYYADNITVLQMAELDYWVVLNGLR